MNCTIVIQKIFFIVDYICCVFIFLFILSYVCYALCTNWMCELTWKFQKARREQRDSTIIVGECTTQNTNTIIISIIATNKYGFKKNKITIKKHKLDFVSKFYFLRFYLYCNFVRVESDLLATIIDITILSRKTMRKQR